MTVRANPIYQICETGASVELFSRTSQENRDSSFSMNALSISGWNIDEENPEIIINQEDTNNWREIEIQKDTPLNSIQDIEIIINKNAREQESVKSSISSSAISEGSLIVQNLPASKIVFATK